jgi:leader peptidase (prepilin peptidase)/N-methyltransferase
LAACAVPGLALGSYAVTAGVRMSRGEGSSRGRSRCDACGAQLGLLQTVPIASYIGLRGACRHCGARIDPLHLVGEVGGAAIVVSAFAVAEPLRATALSALGLALLAASVVDGRIRRLPDILTGFAAVAALALAASDGVERALLGLAAAAIATAILSLLRWTGERTRGEAGLGWGDVKLIAALALWLGAATPMMVLVASVLGLIAAPWLRGPDRRLPFGPAIALAGWAVGLCLEAEWTPWAL